MSLKARRLTPRCCYGKLQFEPEEAASRLWRYPDPNTEIYLCGFCGWCHFGRQPVRFKEAAVRAIAAHKETRYQESVKRQKNRLHKPAWMNDPRGYVQKMDFLAG